MAERQRGHDSPMHSEKNPINSHLVRSKKCQAKTAEYLCNINNEEGHSSRLRPFISFALLFLPSTQSSSSPSRTGSGAAKVQTMWWQIYTVHAATATATTLWYPMDVDVALRQFALQSHETGELN
ncbi:hypothetical protein NL676_014703 [Syzygium grande]|nr:hypothetical protein NL676_014703 [Syzygium grande]